MPYFDGDFLYVGKSLKPTSSPKGEDQYGKDRLRFPEDRDEALGRFVRLVDEKVFTGTMEQFCFSRENGFNNKVSGTHAEEVINIEALKDIVGMENLRAPRRQGETTDIILVRDDNTEVNISVKTATPDGSPDTVGHPLTCSVKPRTFGLRFPPPHTRQARLHV
jgi:hypothetical protein